MNSYWSYSPETLNLGQIDDFLAVRPWNLTDDLEPESSTSSKQHQALCIISSLYVNSNWSYGPETDKWVHDLSNLDLWPLTLTFRMDIMSVNSNTPENFRMIRWEEHCKKVWHWDGHTDRQTEISVVRAAWSQLKTIGHLFYTTSSFVQHLVAIGEFRWSYTPETPNLGQIRRFLEPCDLEIWRMTLKNNRAHLLCYFKLCAAFRSHWWIQTWVTVRKRPIWVKFDDF